MFKKLFEKISAAFFKRAKPRPSHEASPLSRPLQEVDKTIQAIIGLDFGTAYTKAAVRVGARDVYFIKFNGVPGITSPCLLPCVMSVDQSGKYYLGVSDKAKKLVSQLKLSLMHENTDHEQKVSIVLFLAFVLSYIRDWFAKNCGQNYPDRKFEWHLNIGVPAESWHDEKLCDKYKQICRFAWNLSLFEHVDITYENADLIIQKAHDDGFIKSDGISQERIGLIPEFVAQIASYTRSPRRESGLHFLVDIGAATLDVVTFSIWDDGIQDQFPIYVSRVRPLGTHFLCKHLINDDKKKANDLLYEGYLCFNNKPIEEVLSKYSISDQRARELCNPFKIKVKEIIYDVLKNTRFRRDPRSHHWKHGVPAFICGGGAHISLYHECVEAFDKDSLKFRLKVRPMSLPAVASDNMGDTSRLTVAFGLSFDKDDLGRIVPEHEIQDLHENRSIRNTDSSFVSKDQV